MEGDRIKVPFLAVAAAVAAGFWGKFAFFGFSFFVYFGRCFLFRPRLFLVRFKATAYLWGGVARMHP